MCIASLQCMSAVLQLTVSLHIIHTITNQSGMATKKIGILAAVQQA